MAEAVYFNGLFHSRPSNRAKSPSVEQRTSPCSIAQEVGIDDASPEPFTLGDCQDLGDIVEAGVQTPSEVGSGSPVVRRTIGWGSGHPAQSLSKRLVDEGLEAAPTASVRAPKQRSDVGVDGQCGSHASKHANSDVLMSIRWLLLRWLRLFHRRWAFVQAIPAGNRGPIGSPTPRPFHERQRERFAHSSETDTMIILPILVCGRHAGFK